MKKENVYDSNGLYSPTKAYQELKDKQDIKGKFDKTLTLYEAEKLIEAMEKGIIDTDLNVIDDSKKDEIIK